MTNCTNKQQNIGIKHESSTSALSETHSANLSQDSWFLAAAKSKQELRAVEQLKNQGINAFCPMIKVEKLQRGKKKIIEEALFCGYLFVNLSTDSPRWHKVRSTRGIRDWVRFAGEVAKLPIDLVNNLIEMTTKTDQQVIISRFNQGQKVRILSGPFSGLKGIYDKDDGELRSMILVDFLGQTNRLKIANEQITTD